MNLDELVTSVPEAKLKVELLQWVAEWKKDSSDVNRLYELVAKWHCSASTILSGPVEGHRTAFSRRLALR